MNPSMHPITVGAIVFICTLAAALFGVWLRTALPERQLDAESKDTVKVGIALVATMTALILGLVNVSAKNSFDAVDGAVKQSAAEVLALDRVLARYGTETAPIRQGMKDAIRARMDLVWPQDSFKLADLHTLATEDWLSGTERFADAIHGLRPQNEFQQMLQERSLDIAESLLQTRWLVTDSTTSSIPVPFLVVLTFWLMVIFASFGLFAPRNATVITTFAVCTLSVAAAVFLILELDGPFDGLLKVTADPLRYALAHLNE